MRRASLASALIRVATVAIAVGVLEASAIASEPSWASAQQPSVTFAKDIAPLVFQHCATCHRPAGSAPFSLLTYDEVKRRATEIVSVTGSRVMPPWKPEPGYGEFAGERRLRGEQNPFFQRWGGGGATE